MREQLIRFETAKLAKEKGFDSYSEDYYINETGKFETSLSAVVNNKTITKTYTQSVLQKWLREIHNIDIIVKPWTGDIKGTKTYAADITIMFTNTYKKLARVDTYEQSLEMGLQEALKLI